MQGEFTVGRMITEYFGNRLWIAVFAIALVLLLLFIKKKTRRLILSCLIVFGLIIFNPKVPELLDSQNQAVFYRFLWALPLSIPVVYVCIELVSRIKNIILKALITIALVGALLLVGISTGDTAFNRENTIENEYLLSNETIWMNELLAKYENGNEKVKIAMPQVLQMQLRALNPMIVATITRSDYIKLEKGRLEEIKESRMALIDIVNGRGFPPEENVPNIFNKTKTKYIITLSTVPEDYMASCGCTKLDQTNFFTLYRTA